MQPVVGVMAETADQALPPPPPRGELDGLTLARARRGDQGACRELVLRYQGPVFALLSRFLGPSGEGQLVEDLAQETFLRAFRELPRFRPGGPARLSTWLLTIATRLAIDEHRRSRRRPQRASLKNLGDQPAPAGSPEAEAERRCLGRRLERAVQQELTAEQRAVFLLRAYHDLDYREISEALGCDVGTVRSRLSRARARLKAALEDEER